MNDITATTKWVREDNAAFTDNRYSRKHVWHFDGGIEVPASSSPSVVPVPLSSEQAVDPEEAFVASLSSCHMLWFLALAARQKLTVNRYIDHAIGQMDKNEDGKTVISIVTLRPKIEWDGDAPSTDVLEKLHHQAHEACFIANSVRSEVKVEPFPT